MPKGFGALFGSESLLQKRGIHARLSTEDGK